MSRSLLTVVVLASSTAWAGDPEADPEADDTVIVYEPDGTPRVAGSAHVVGEEELERFEYNDIARVLGATPGVYVRGEDGFGLRPNIGLRGANSDRSAKITLLEDGVPVSPAPYAASAAYYFPMATRLVGVEVFKGPAAIAHGPQTVGGAINLLTRRVPQKPDGMVDFGYGMRNTAKLHAWAGSGTERGGVLGEVSHLQTDGFKHLPDDGPTGFERTDVMFKGTVSSDPALVVKNALTVKLGFGQEHSHETYLGLHVDDYAEDPYARYGASGLDDMSWRRTQAEATWQLDLSPAVRIRTTAYHHWLSRQWFKFNGFRNGPSVHELLQEPEGGATSEFLDVLRGADTTRSEQALMIGTNDRRFHALGVQSRLQWRTKAGRIDSQLKAGVRVHGDIVDRTHTQGAHTQTDGVLTRDETKLETTLDSHATATALAVHVQEDLQIGAVHLLPGLRTETVRTGYVNLGSDNDVQLRTSVLPGFGALAEVFDDLQVFAGVYRGFSPVPPGQDADVSPETSISSEAGLRIGGLGSRLEVVGFLNDYANITGQCTISGGCVGEQLDTQYNGGKAWVYGAEGSAAHEWLLPRQLRLPVSLAYTWTETRFRTGFVSGFPQFGTVEVGDRLPYVPQHQGGARIALEHPRFGLAVGASARSGMRDTASQGPLATTDIPAQLLVDVSARVRPAEHFEVYSTVVNATNTHVVESWRPFGARPTSPFQLMAGVKVTP
ncbi:MAG: TonB-dependent receptor [Myxococcota bacterium]